MAAKNLKDHAITASLNRLSELLSDKSLQDPRVASDEAAQFNRDKLLNVVRSLRTLVNQSSATMVSESALNQMNSNLQQPISELTSFVSNRNVGHLANAVYYIDQNVLNYSWAFYPRALPASKAEVAEVLDAIQTKSRETFGILDEQKNELAEQISELIKQIEAQKTRLDEIR